MENKKTYENTESMIDYVHSIEVYYVLLMIFALGALVAGIEYSQNWEIFWLVTTGLLALSSIILTIVNRIIESRIFKKDTSRNTLAVCLAGIYTFLAGFIGVVIGIPIPLKWF